MRPVLTSFPDFLPAIVVWTATMVWFGLTPIQDPTLLPCGMPNMDRYKSTHGSGGLCLDSSVPISASPLCVCLCIVAYRYSTVNLAIFTLLHHCLLLMYSPTVYLKQKVTHTLPHPENERH